MVHGFTLLVSGFNLSGLSFPYAQVVPMLMGVVAVLIVILCEKWVIRFCDDNEWIYIAIIVFFVAYILMLGAVAYQGLYYEWDLNRYDLNHDRIFSPEEQTREQRAANMRLISDVGRNLACFTLIFPSILMSIAGYVLGKSLGKKDRKHEHE